MNSYAALALLMQATSPHSVSSENPAISAFREACVEGSLKLTPERGRILEGKELNEYMVQYGWDRTPAHSTIIKLAQSPTSYIVLNEYKNVQSRSIARSCALISRTITKEEAMAAFLEGLPDKNVAPAWMPIMYLPSWTADHPELGYRKHLSFGNHKSIVLELGMYPAAASQMNAGTTKQ